MITKDQTQTLIKKFGKTEKDSGSIEVQVALITKRIENLTPHFEANPKDHHSKRGLLKLVGQRKSLLIYLKRTNTAAYQKLIEGLGLRK